MVIMVKDGIEKKEVFKGEVGEVKLKELESKVGNLNLMIVEEVMKEIKFRKVSMVDENGDKILIIEEIKNGKILI